MITVAGTTASGELLLKVTMSPPAPAKPLRYTVPEMLLLPITDVGDKTNLESFAGTIEIGAEALAE